VLCRSCEKVAKTGMDTGINGTANTSEFAKVDASLSSSKAAVLDIASSADIAAASNNNLNDFEELGKGDGVIATITLGVDGMLSESSDPPKLGDTISSPSSVQNISPTSVDNPLALRLHVGNTKLPSLLKTGLTPTPEATL